jgi:4-amino-4-deoxy-L-arabinose transferase-like glycosyltransferase
VLLKALLVLGAGAIALVGWLRVRRPQRGGRPWAGQVVAVVVTLAWLAAMVLVATAI